MRSGDIYSLRLWPWVEPTLWLGSHGSWAVGGEEMHCGSANHSRAKRVPTSSVALRSVYTGRESGKHFQMVFGLQPQSISQTRNSQDCINSCRCQNQILQQRLPNPLWSRDSGFWLMVEMMFSCLVSLCVRYVPALTLIDCSEAL